MKLEWFANEWNDHYLTENMDLMTPYIWVNVFSRSYLVTIRPRLTQQESTIIFEYPGTDRIYKVLDELTEIAKLYLPEAVIDPEVHHVV